MSVTFGARRSSLGLGGYGRPWGSMRDHKLGTFGVRRSSEPCMEMNVKAWPKIKMKAIMNNQ